MTYATHHLYCPVCYNPIVVTVDPGEEPVYYPNDRAHPGAPPALDGVDGCECWDSMHHFQHVGHNGRKTPGEDWYADTVLEKLGEKAVF